MKKNTTRIALVFLLFNSFAAFHQGVQAQPYKCNVGGKTVYQEVRCEGGVPVNLSGAGKADPKSPAANQVRREIAAMKRKDLIDNAILENKIIVGMTTNEVVMSWGQPSKINTTVSGGGRSEQWVYRREKIGYDQYVYVDNGFVRSMQSSK